MSKLLKISGMLVSQNLTALAMVFGSRRAYIGLSSESGANISSMDQKGKNG
jgi:hypothetical protein